MKARRYNKGKLNYSLIPPEVLEELAKVYTYGAHKYSIYEGNIKGSEIPIEDIDNHILIESGKDNWKKGLLTSNYLDSAIRHIEAYRKGEDLDELGTHTLANAIWNLSSILWTNKHLPELDDRDLWYKKPLKKVWFDLDGVIFEFEQYFLNYLGLPLHNPTDWNDIRFRENMYKVDNDTEFWINSPILISPEDIQYPIAGYCTSRHCNVSVIKQSLINNGFPEAEIINVQGGRKLDALKGRCDVFIDDSIETFMDLNSNGILCYLATRPHNIKYNVGELRVNGVKEFINKIKN